MQRNSMSHLFGLFVVLQYKDLPTTQFQLLKNKTTTDCDSSGSNKCLLNATPQNYGLLSWNFDCNTFFVLPRLGSHSGYVAGSVYLH